MEDMKKEIVLDEESAQKVLEAVGHGEDAKGAIKVVMVGRGSQEDLKNFIDEKLSPMNVIPPAYTLGHAEGVVYGYRQVVGLAKLIASDERVQKEIGEEGIKALASLLMTAKEMGKAMKKDRKAVKKLIKKDCPWVLELIRQFKEVASEAEDEVEADAEAHKEDLEETMAIFDPDLLSLIKEVEADQDAATPKECEA